MNRATGRSSAASGRCNPPGISDPKGNADRFANLIYSQNPFAWAGRSAAGAGALCTVGKAFWEDYTFTTAVQPGADGAAGVMVNMPDAAQGYLVRWSPANDRGAQGDRLTLAQRRRRENHRHRRRPRRLYPRTMV